MKSILILKRSALGDVVHTLAIIPPLRERFPEARITWMTGPGYGALLNAAEGIDEVIEVGFRKGKLQDYFNTLKKLKRERYDALIDFQGSLKAWLLILSANAKRKIGFNRADARESIVTRLYHEQIPALPPGLHVIRQYLRLLQPLGIETDNIRFPALKTNRRDNEATDRWLAEQGVKTVIFLNPFTTWKTKNWPERHAAELSLLISKRLKAKTILLWGPGERERAEGIVAAARGAALLAPHTDVLKLVALLRRADLYIGGDTGPTQLAAALGVPIVAIFGPTDPLRTGPFAPDDVWIREDLACERCSRNRCYESDPPECMLRITPDIVIKAVFERLDLDYRE